jgi:hypothetical protein
MMRDDKENPAVASSGHAKLVGGLGVRRRSTSEGGCRNSPRRNPVTPIALRGNSRCEHWERNDVVPLGRNTLRYSAYVLLRALAGNRPLTQHGEASVASAAPAE